MKRGKRALTAIAAVALATSPALAQSGSVGTNDPIAEAWVPATDAEQEAARGGAAPVFVVLYLGGHAVIRQCLIRVQACQAGGVAVLKSLVEARRYACRRYGRFC